MQVSKGEREAYGRTRRAHAPRSRILHSFRNLLESSSRILSIAWLFFFCSASSLLELMQIPISATVCRAPGRDDSLD